MIKLLMPLIVPLCLAMPGTVFADQVGGGDIIFLPKNMQPVVFSHELHGSEKGLKCLVCHYQISKMARGSYKIERTGSTKDSLCGKCHNGKKSFDVKDAKNCVRCHT
jgi:c(7)-type cytochrome triheme protein